jgi:hypothetical protein
MVTKSDERSRFEIEQDGHTAFLEFEEDGDRLDLVSTQVPDELGGRGIGGQLAKGALQYAREHKMRVKVTCEFVRSYLERHPEERDVVDD